MRKAVQSAGFILVLMGISGTVDRLAYQPIMGPAINAFNRYVIPRVDFLIGYEVYANLFVAALGVIVIVAGGWIKTP